MKLFGRIGDLEAHELHHNTHINELFNTLNKALDRVSRLECKVGELQVQCDWAAGDIHHPAKYKRGQQVNILVVGAILPGKIVHVGYYEPKIGVRKYIVETQKGLGTIQYGRTEDQILAISTVNGKEQAPNSGGITTEPSGSGCWPTLGGALTTTDTKDPVN